MFGYLATFTITMLIIYYTIPLDVWSIITGTSLSLMIWLFTWLNITYNWKWLCWPGLPVMLMDDINYFAVHTLMPKCMWFWSFLVTTPYDNNNCYSCDTVRNLTMANCVTDGGFSDLASNLLFMLQYYAPSSLQWLRDTTIPPFSIIYQIPFVNNRVNAFANKDYSNPNVFAFYMGCNYIVTLIPNFIIFSLFFLLATIVAPVVSFAFNIASTLFNFLLSGIWILAIVFQSFFIMLSTMTFYSTGTTDTILPEKNVTTKNGKVVKDDEEEGGDGSNNDTQNNTPSSSVSSSSQDPTKLTGNHTRNQNPQASQSTFQSPSPSSISLNMNPNDIQLQQFPPNNRLPQRTIQRSSNQSFLPNTRRSVKTNPSDTHSSYTYSASYNRNDTNTGNDPHSLSRMFQMIKNRFLVVDNEYKNK